MRYTQIDAFAKHLKDASPIQRQEVYLLIAKEELDRKNAEKILLNELPQNQHLKIFEGSHINMDAFLDEINTLSFLAKEKMILLREADKLSKENLSNLAAILDNPNPSVCLILTASSLQRRSLIYQKAEKQGIIYHQQEEKPWERKERLKRFCISYASQNHKHLEPAACQHLMDLLGQDSTRMQNELEKLICYVGEKQTITVNDVNAIFGTSPAHTVWELGEAIFLNDTPKASHLIQDLLKQGESWIGLIRQLRSQFQLKLEIASEISLGKSSQEISKSFPQLRGKLLDKNIHFAKRWGICGLTKAILTLDQAETHCKTLNLDHNLLANLLLLKL